MSPLTPDLRGRFLRPKNTDCSRYQPLEQSEVSFSLAGRGLALHNGLSAMLPLRTCAEASLWVGYKSDRHLLDEKSNIYGASLQ